jgi:hypothetical protein
MDNLEMQTKLDTSKNLNNNKTKKKLLISVNVIEREEAIKNGQSTNRDTIGR